MSPPASTMVKPSKLFSETTDQSLSQCHNEEDRETRKLELLEAQVEAALHDAECLSLTAIPRRNTTTSQPMPYNSIATPWAPRYAKSNGPVKFCPRTKQTVQWDVPENLHNFFNKLSKPGVFQQGGHVDVDPSQTSQLHDFWTRAERLIARREARNFHHDNININSSSSRRRPASARLSRRLGQFANGVASNARRKPGLKDVDVKDLRDPRRAVKRKVDGCASTAVSSPYGQGGGDENNGGFGSKRQRMMVEQNQMKMNRNRRNLGGFNMGRRVRRRREVDKGAAGNTVLSGSGAGGREHASTTQPHCQDEAANNNNSHDQRKVTSRKRSTDTLFSSHGQPNTVTLFVSPPGPEGHHAPHYVPPAPSAPGPCPGSVRNVGNPSLTQGSPYGPTHIPLTQVLPWVHHPQSQQLGVQQPYHSLQQPHLPAKPSRLITYKPMCHEYPPAMGCGRWYRLQKQEEAKKNGFLALLQAMFCCCC